MRRRNKGLSFYRKKKKISAGTVREIFVYIFGICVAVFLAFILVYSVGMSVSVIGVSMEPEFTNGQKVLVNRYAYLLTSQSRMMWWCFCRTATKIPTVTSNGW